MRSERKVKSRIVTSRGEQQRRERLVGREKRFFTLIVLKVHDDGWGGGVRSKNESRRIGVKGRPTLWGWGKRGGSRPRLSLLFRAWVLGLTEMRNNPLNLFYERGGLRRHGPNWWKGNL